jgi:hypothetical protein
MNLAPKPTTDASIAALSDVATPIQEGGELARNIASNPSTHPQLLQQMATVKDRELRKQVACNPNTPTEVLWELGIDFPDEILANPIFKLLQLEDLNLPAKIPHCTLISLLQCDRVPHSFMEYALSQQDYSLWLAVAYNPQTPAILLEHLAHKSRRQDRELLRAVAAHPQTPPLLLSDLVEISYNLARVVTENPQTPVTVLQKVLRIYGRSHGLDRMFTTLVALHPHLNPQLLLQMYLAPDETTANSLWLAKQSTTESAQLVKLADTSWDVLNLAVARHPNTPTMAIEQIWHKIKATHLGESAINQIIYDSFAMNPNTSIELRQELRKLIEW